MRCNICGFRKRGKHHNLGANHLNKARDIGVPKTRVIENQTVKRTKSKRV